MKREKVKFNLLVQSIRHWWSINSGCLKRSLNERVDSQLRYALQGSSRGRQEGRGESFKVQTAVDCPCWGKLSPSSLTSASSSFSSLQCIHSFEFNCYPPRKSLQTQSQLGYRSAAATFPNDNSEQFTRWELHENPRLTAAGWLAP